MSSRRNALGRSLGDLMSHAPVKVAAPTEKKEAETGPQGVRHVDLKKIRPNPYQPRHNFPLESLEELAESIRNHGVLQPVLVTKDAKGEGFTLVAGERRLRAAEIAQLQQIPVLVQEFTEEEMLEIAIVENVQRDDLNPVDEARAYRRLVDSFGWSQEQVAQRVGKRRSTVANALRLLKLGEDALRDLEEGRMTPGHARAILSIDDTFYRARLRQEVVDKGISVREAEKRALAYQKGGGPTRRGSSKKTEAGRLEDVDIVALAERLMTHLGCRVRIESKDGVSGKVEIPFQSPDELQRFLEAVGLPE